MTHSRLTHLIALSRHRPRLTWRDVPNLLAGLGVVWLWVGLNWAAWAFLWSVIY